MDSPVQAFLTWFNSLPPGQRQEAAGFILAFNPLFGDIDPTRINEVAEDFIANVSRHLDGTAGKVGVVLALRATVDFFVMRNRTTRADWDETSAKLAAMKAILKQRGEHPRLQEMLESQSLEMPLRREQWLATAEKWKELCISELSDESLERWSNSVMRPQIPGGQ